MEKDSLVVFGSMCCVFEYVCVIVILHRRLNQIYKRVFFLPNN